MPGGGVEDVDRAGAGAARRDALEKKGAGGLRLQVKYNAVYAYEVLGCGQEEFVKDWNKTTGSVLGVGLDPTKLTPCVRTQSTDTACTACKRNQRPSRYPSLN